MLLTSFVSLSRYSLPVVQTSLNFFGVRPYCTEREFIQGTSDYAFKKLFRNKDVLIPVLNDAFQLVGEREIIDLDYTDPHHPGSRDVKSKATTFDLSCQTKRGERIIIEMQRAWQVYFYKRALYDWALEVCGQDKLPAEKMVTTQRNSKFHKKGEIFPKVAGWDYNFEPVYQFSVCDFPIFPNDQRLKYEPLLRGLIHFNGQEPVLDFIPPFRLCFMQLSNFPQMPPLVGSPAEKIGTLLKNLHKFNSRDEIPEVLRKDPLCARAIDILSTANLSREEKADYERDLKHSRDEYARQQTLEIAQRQNEEKDRKLEEKDRKNEELMRKNEELMRKDEEKDRKLEELMRKLEELMRRDEEKDRKLEELSRKIQELTSDHKGGNNKE